ncbi:Uncharacterised protein [Mycobacteroides abscessus subsp. abscessus]|nr:Uncharacterised protein [Mycobacteroides abscessus subsp. abscessus]
MKLVNVSRWVKIEFRINLRLRSLKWSLITGMMKKKMMMMTSIWTMKMRKRTPYQKLSPIVMENYIVVICPSGIRR